MTLYQYCSNSFSSLCKIAARAKKRKIFICLLLNFETISQESSVDDLLPKLLAEAYFKSHPDVRVTIKMVCSIEDADPNYDLDLSDNLNILGSHDTKVSEPGRSWPSFVFNT